MDRKLYAMLCAPLLLVSMARASGPENALPDGEDTRIEARSQQRSVSGTVRDAGTGNPLSGVSIFIKGTGRGTSSDADGNYRLADVPQGAILAFSYLGYEQTEKTIGNQHVVNVSLQALGSQLNEVVVVGYQRQSVKKTTSAVQVISGEQIENLAAPSFESLLQGRVSGINIQNFTGEPGARNTFTVRGNTTISPDLNAEIDLANTMSTPLYIIDGMPLSVTDLAGSSATGTNYIAGININDIDAGRTA